MLTISKLSLTTFIFFFLSPLYSAQKIVLLVFMVSVSGKGNIPKFYLNKCSNAITVK